MRVLKVNAVVEYIINNCRGAIRNMCTTHHRCRVAMFEHNTQPNTNAQQRRGKISPQHCVYLVGYLLFVDT